MSPIIGIDLGTTYCTVATIDQYGRPVVVKNADGQPLTPSVVYIDPVTGQATCGSDAKEMLQAGEENCAMFFKRFMGDASYNFYSGDRVYSATDLSAMLLRKLKADAELTLGQEIKDVVITVPAYFNDLQRSETVEAGRKAGLNVMRIINEPTAAAITFGIARDRSQRILVYDLGGGTFDVTILDITPTEIRVLATGGDHQLGGKDWDDCLVQYVSEQFRIETGNDVTESIEVYNDLAYNCETLKKQLSSRESAAVTVRYNGARGKYTVTREQFEQLTDGLLRSTKSVTEIVMQEAGLTWHDLDGVLLVGGSTRMPMVSNWVREMSGKEPLRGVNVDEAVALGAAVQASIEAERSRYTLGGGSAPTPKVAGIRAITDVMSHSLGAVAVSSDGERYVNSIIIPKNRPIPVAEHKPFLFTTGRGIDNELTLYLTQGESTEIAECLVVGKYLVTEIEDRSNGESKIDIEYAYDANGMIAVAATQTETGRKLKVTKVPLEEDMSWLYNPVKRSIPVDIFIAIDLSGSMSGKPERKAREAASNFVETIDLDPSQMAMIGFADRGKVYCDLTSDKRQLLRDIKRMDVGSSRLGCCNDCDGLGYIYDHFKLKDPDGRKKIVIILTDGVWDCQNHAIHVSDICRKEGIDVIAIGFGGADKKFLKRISTSDESALLTDLNNLVANFGNIAREISASGGVAGLKWK